MIGIGKQTRINQAAIRKLVKIYAKKEIFLCEIYGLNCNRCWGLSFAHRHKRRWYYEQPELLSEFSQTLLICLPCHMELEKSETLTERYFKMLRGEEMLDTKARI